MKIKDTIQKNKAIDTLKYAQLQAIKSIIPPPHLLDVGHFNDEIKAGRTGTMAHMENEKRVKEYQNTITRMADYIEEQKTISHKVVGQAVVELLKGMKVKEKVPHNHEETLIGIREQGWNHALTQAQNNIKEEFGI